MNVLLSFILWLLLVFSIIRLRNRERYDVDEVEANYPLNDISKDEMGLIAHEERPTFGGSQISSFSRRLNGASKPA